MKWQNSSSFPLNIHSTLSVSCSWECKNKCAFTAVMQWFFMHHSCHMLFTPPSLLRRQMCVVMLRRFMKWFTSADDEQTACCTKRGTADHVFWLRCMLQHAKRLKLKLFMLKLKLFMIAKTFTVPWSFLLQILCLFGARIALTTCFTSIKMMSADSILRRGGLNVRFERYLGIKKGLPVCLFYR